MSETNTNLIQDHELTVGDLDWILNHIDDSDKNFLQDYFSQIDVKINTSGASKDAIIAYYKAIVQSSAFEFESDPIDQDIYDKFLRSDYESEFDCYSQFQELWNGYSEERLINTASLIKDDKKALIKEADKMKTKIKKALKVATRNRNSIRIKMFTEHLENVKTIEEEIRTAFSDAYEMAKIKLRHEVYKRRHISIMTFLDAITPDDYTLFNYQLRRIDPELSTWPLRFMIHIPLPVYNKLRKYALQGVGRDEMMEHLIASYSIDIIFKRIEVLAVRLKPIKYEDREFTIKEIKTSWNMKNYLSATLVAVTQVEGIIWDFAQLLNRRSIRIFKNEKNGKTLYRPYEWDHKLESYKNLNPATKKPVASSIKSLQSANHMLQETRMGSILYKDIYEYLIDDFFNDRNKLAHGYLTGRNLRADSISAIYCLESCMTDIASYLEKKGIK